MINDEPLSQFHLRLAAPEGDAEELDDLTQNLRREWKNPTWSASSWYPAAMCLKALKPGWSPRTGN